MLVINLILCPSQSKRTIVMLMNRQCIKFVAEGAGGNLEEKNGYAKKIKS